MGLLDMFGISPSKSVYETVQSTLEDVVQELGCTYEDCFIVIKPTKLPEDKKKRNPYTDEDAQFEHRYYICKFNDAGGMQKVREIALKEILSGKEEE